MAGQGNLENTWKVTEKSGNLKINGYGRQSSENLSVLKSTVQEEKGCTFSEIVLAHLPSHLGYF